MLSSITALMRGLVDLVKVLKRPGYMVLALALLAIGFELLAGGFWLRFFNWVLGGDEFRELFTTELSKNPIQSALGACFIFLGVGVVCYFEYLRMLGGEINAKNKLPISTAQKRVLKAFQHKKFDRQHLSQCLDMDLLRVASQEPVNTVQTLHIHFVSQWVLHPKSMKTTFTELSLLLDYGRNDIEGRFRVAATFSSLSAILNNVEQQQHQSFVLLGRPGGGKSTLLKHLQFELSLEALTQRKNTVCPIPFFMRLNEYPPEHNTFIEPEVWLSQRWSRMYPNLPSLEATQKQYGVVFLLDALNEMRCTDPQDYFAKVKRWKQWLVNLKEQHRNCRVVFTCRQLNYSEPLSTEVLMVPQIQFEDLSNDKIREYLQHYLPCEGQVLFERLKQLEGFSEFKTPFYLNLAIEYYQYSQDFTHVTPSSLIASMIWLALERELQKTADKFSLESLTDKDRKRITLRSWLMAPHQLPDDGFLIQYLIKTAWLMQQGCSGKDSHQVNISENQLIERLEHEQLSAQHIDAMLSMASDLELLERDLMLETCQFTHQILQEYLAAHEWNRAPNFLRVQKPYLINKMAESLDETLKNLSVADPLPPPFPHGWEQTVLHAAVFTADKGGFIRDLAAHDLVLAASCATQQKSQLDAKLITSLQQQLLHRMQDGNSDLRARIAAGHALGHLGDHRLMAQITAQGRNPFIEPHWVKVFSGTACIGDHQVSVGAFHIAQHLVSNAEWHCFMVDGGYENPQWWEAVSEDAELWRQGKYEERGAIDRNKQRFLEFKDDFEKVKIRYNYNDFRANKWKKLIEQPYEQFCEQLDEQYGARLRREPREWSNPRFNNPSQPVVGIGLFEISAYCQWLSDTLGQDISLPTEPQWRLATQCLSHDKQLLRYPWGQNFKALQANTLESHILSTTPIGLFPESVIPRVEGVRSAEIFDAVGNVREWALAHLDDTRRLNTAPETLDADKIYTTIGGSWGYEAKGSALTVSGYEFRASNRYNHLGFRLVKRDSA